MLITWACRHDAYVSVFFHQLFHVYIFPSFFSRCCSCMQTQGYIKDDNCCRCNTSAIRKTTGIHPDDIVYASFHNKVRSGSYLSFCNNGHVGMFTSGFVGLLPNIEMNDAPSPAVKCCPSKRLRLI